jgi:hypothetical protein
VKIEEKSVIHRTRIKGPKILFPKILSPSVSELFFYVNIDIGDRIMMPLTCHSSNYIDPGADHLHSSLDLLGSLRRKVTQPYKGFLTHQCHGTLWTFYCLDPLGESRRLSCGCTLFQILQQPLTYNIRSTRCRIPGQLLAWQITKRRIAWPFIRHAALPQSFGTFLAQELLDLDAFCRTKVGIFPLLDRALRGETVTNLPCCRARPVDSSINFIGGPPNSAFDAGGCALCQQRQADVEQQSLVPALAGDRIRGNLAEAGVRKTF